jgi:hypothetical protein
MNSPVSTWTQEQYEAWVKHTPTPWSRNQYNDWLRYVLKDVLAPEDLERELRAQYPKDAASARAELRTRGVDVLRLPDRQAYGAEQLDAIVMAAALCGGLRTITVGA